MRDYESLLAKHCTTQVDGLEQPKERELMECIAEALNSNERAFSVVTPNVKMGILERNVVIASRRANDELDIKDSPDFIVAFEEALVHSVRRELKSLELDVVTLDDYPARGGEVVVSDVDGLLNKKDVISEMLPVERIRLLIGNGVHMLLFRGDAGVVGKFGESVKIGLADAYSHALYKEGLGDVEKNLRSADGGFFRIDGKVYATIEKWAEHLGVASGALDTCLKDVHGIVRKFRDGHVLTLYPESDIFKYCGGLCFIRKIW